MYLLQRRLEINHNCQLVKKKRKKRLTNTNKQIKKQTKKKNKKKNTKKENKNKTIHNDLLWQTFCCELSHTSYIRLISGDTNFEVLDVTFQPLSSESSNKQPLFVKRKKKKDFDDTKV